MEVNFDHSFSDETAFVSDNHISDTITLENSACLWLYCWEDPVNASQNLDEPSRS